MSHIVYICTVLSEQINDDDDDDDGDKMRKLAAIRRDHKVRTSPAGVDWEATVRGHKKMGEMA